MAASTAKQPLPPRLSPLAAVKSTPECCRRLTFPSAAKEERRFLFLKASLREESSGGGDAVRARSKDVQAILDGFSYGYVPKEDAPSLPKPLSLAESSNSPTGGWRLLVAYQGVSGAYRESAAEKAYPNCEAVPCEQFDTAFQHVAYSGLKDTGAGG